jgi:hypothetical protein
MVQRATEAGGSRPIENGWEASLNVYQSILSSRHSPVHGIVILYPSYDYTGAIGAIAGAHARHLATHRAYETTSACVNVLSEKQFSYDSQG